MHTRAYTLFASLFFCLSLSFSFPVHARDALPTLSPMIKEVMPAVVGIEIFSRKPSPSRSQEGLQSQLPPDSPLRKLFPPNKGGENSNREKVGAGSGFVIDPSGIIITNNHVIDEAEEIEVVFFDGKRLPGTIQGKDATADLAIIKVAPKGKLPFVMFGNSDITEVGDWVVAIGNPYGIGNSVSIGIISAKHREIPGMPAYLQTDASINSGNSGGPLFNQKGEVIGVNTAIFSPTGGSVGIGFAVPSNFATFITSELRTHGRVRRIWMGISVVQISQQTAGTMGAPQGGILIRGVEPGSPSQEGGLKERDIIVSWNGQAIETMRDFEGATYFVMRAGNTVKLKVLRSKEQSGATIPEFSLVEIILPIKERPESN